MLSGIWEFSEDGVWTACLPLGMSFVGTCHLCCDGGLVAAGGNFAPGEPPA